MFYGVERDGGCLAEEQNIKEEDGGQGRFVIYWLSGSNQVAITIARCVGWQGPAGPSGVLDDLPDLVMAIQAYGVLTCSQRVRDVRSF